MDLGQTDLQSKSQIQFIWVFPGYSKSVLSLSALSLWIGEDSVGKH